MLERFRRSDGTLLHRCPECWAAGPNAGMDNGFVPVGQKVVHSRSCGLAGRKVQIVRATEDAPPEIKRLFGRLVGGSVAVIVPDASEGWRVYYEGGIYSRSGRDATQEEREEYAKIAAGRAIDRYPTTAFFWVPSLDGLVCCGEVDCGLERWFVSFHEDRPL